jgi:hypothetical protein
MEKRFKTKTWSLPPDELASKVKYHMSSHQKPKPVQLAAPEYVPDSVYEAFGHMALRPDEEISSAWWRSGGKEKSTEPKGYKQHRQIKRTFVASLDPNSTARIVREEPAYALVCTASAGTAAGTSLTSPCRTRHYRQLSLMLMLHCMLGKSRYIRTMTKRQAGHSHLVTWDRWHSV